MKEVIDLFFKYVTISYILIYSSRKCVEEIIYYSFYLVQQKQGGFLTGRNYH